MTTLNSASGHGPLKVFVVENHPDTMHALGSYLAGLGHVVTSARSQTEALEMLATTDCDVFISDIGLPDGNGWELMERADLPSSVYCVAMSGFGAHADRRRSRAAGYRHHLMKPFNPQELDAILDEAAQQLAVR